MEHPALIIVKFAIVPLPPVAPPLMRPVLSHPHERLLTLKALTACSSCWMPPLDDAAKCPEKYVLDLLSAKECADAST